MHASRSFQEIGSSITVERYKREGALCSRYLHMVDEYIVHATGNGSNLPMYRLQRSEPMKIQQTEAVGVGILTRVPWLSETGSKVEP